MENKRAGFSFKAVGVVGFILLAFLLLRVLRLPDGALSSEMMPNFLMLFLGVLILASSFILLALGRIVELLENFKGSQTLLREIRDETERVRIESQYIYEVQKETLVKLSDANLSDANNVVSVQEQDMSLKETAQTNNDHTTIGLEHDNEPIINESTPMATNSAKLAEENPSDVKPSNAGLAAAKAASFVNNPLNRSDFEEVTTVDQDVKANTDESTWSTLVSFDKEEDASELPLTDADSDRAALDGSDDIVDDAPQSKNWQPVSAEELTNREKAGFQENKFREADFSEVKDYQISGLSDNNGAVAVGVNEQIDASKLANESESKKPVFDDRLSQTEKTKDLADNSVRFGSFPDDAKTESVNPSLNANVDVGDTEGGSSFTLEDITDQDFSKDVIVNTEQNITRQENSTKQESLEEVFSNLKDSEKDKTAQQASYEKESGFRAKDFDSKGFGSMDSNTSFENAEDSFDDIREVFDTKAKKLTSAVDSNRVKDRLKAVSDEIANKASDVGKNLN